MLCLLPNAVLEHVVLQNVMKISGQRRQQLEEMALVLEENKNLQASVTDLQARLTQERHHREDLQVNVLALEKDRQLLEAENQSLAEQCSRSTDQQKGMSLNLALLIISVVRRLPMSAALEMELSLFAGQCCLV